MSASSIVVLLNIWDTSQNVAIVYAAAWLPVQLPRQLLRPWHLPQHSKHQHDALLCVQPSATSVKLPPAQLCCRSLPAHPVPVHTVMHFDVHLAAALDTT